MRRVEIFKFKKEGENNGKPEWSKYSLGFGYLLGFGVGFREAYHTIVQFSTAIVEMPDGSVQNVKVDSIKFVNPLEDVAKKDKDSLKQDNKEKKSSYESKHIYIDERDDIPF